LICYRCWTPPESWIQERGLAAWASSAQSLRPELGVLRCQPGNESLSKATRGGESSIGLGARDDASALVDRQTALLSVILQFLDLFPRQAHRVLQRLYQTPVVGQRAMPHAISRLQQGQRPLRPGRRYERVRGGRRKTPQSRHRVSLGRRPLEVRRSCSCWTAPAPSHFCAGLPICSRSSGVPINMILGSCSTRMRKWCFFLNLSANSSGE